jgi:hypothetical protein
MAGRGIDRLRIRRRPAAEASAGTKHGLVLDAVVGLTAPEPVGRLVLSTSLLFTWNSNLGKSVEDSTWAGRMWQIPLSQPADRPPGSARLGLIVG